MLPIEIQARLRRPGAIEKNFLEYLQKSKARVNMSKTIASQVLYHQKPVANQNIVQFFTGQNFPGQSNIESTFTRPESEHFVIYGMRCFLGNLTEPGETALSAYTLGITDSPFGDVNFLNSVFSLEINGITLLKNVPLTEFDSLTTTNFAGMLLLNEPLLWQGQQQMKLTLKAKPGVTFGDFNVRFELYGIGLI